MISKNIKNIVIAGVIIGASFLIYSFFLKSDGSNESISSTPSAVEMNQPDNTTGNQILKILGNLKTIRIDKNFFSEPSFTGLQDYSVNLTEEQVGRQNPFISVGAEPAQAPQATPNATQ